MMDIFLTNTLLFASQDIMDAHELTEIYLLKIWLFLLYYLWYQGIMSNLTHPLWRRRNHVTKWADDKICQVQGSIKKDWYRKMCLKFAFH